MRKYLSRVAEGRVNTGRDRIDLRRFRLVTIDQDGTIYKTEPLLIIAKALGRKKEVDELQRMWEEGRISGTTSLRGQFGVLEGMTIRQLRVHMRKVRPINGIKQFVKLLQGFGLRVVLLTDNPSCIANFALKLGFQDIICSHSELSSKDVIRGTDYPLVQKAPALTVYCKKNRIGLDQCLHIGNGANDVPIFNRVGASIALNPESKKVRLTADFWLNANSILDLTRFFANESLNQ